MERTELAYPSAFLLSETCRGTPNQTLQIHPVAP